MPKTTVLVVEDEVLIRLSIVDQLENMDFTVLEAVDADSAIEILEQWDDIQLVFTDVQMPGTMDGLQLAHYVRARWPPTAIVICSANKPPDPTELPTNAYWLGKPFAPKNLELAIDAAKRWLA